MLTLFLHLCKETLKQVFKDIYPASKFDMMTVLLKSKITCVNMLMLRTGVNFVPTLY